jgi:hypothetical protein
MTKINTHIISLWADWQGETVADVIKMLQKFGPGAKFDMEYGDDRDPQDRLVVIEPISETD